MYLFILFISGLHWFFFLKVSMFYFVVSFLDEQGSEMNFSIKGQWFSWIFVQAVLQVLVVVFNVKYLNVINKSVRLININKSHLYMQRWHWSCSLTLVNAAQRQHTCIYTTIVSFYTIHLIIVNSLQNVGLATSWNSFNLYFILFPLMFILFQSTKCLWMVLVC